MSDYCCLNSLSLHIQTLRLYQLKIVHYFFFRWAFTRVIILHYTFMFDVCRFTVYAVIVKKLRVSQLGHIFQCIVYEKLCVELKKYWHHLQWSFLAINGRMLE